MSTNTEAPAVPVLLPPVATWAVDEVGTPICPICQNTGGKYVTQPADPGCKLPDVWRSCQCMRDANRRTAMRKAGVPREHLDCTRESWEAYIGTWASMDLLRLEAWPPKRFNADNWLVVIYGEFGRGKTSLATSLLVEALRQGYKGLWIDCNDWITAMEAAMAEPGGQALEFLRVRNAPFLVFDDMGAVRGGRGAVKQEQSNWWREKVAELLRYRGNQWLPTVVTSNLVSPAEGVPELASWPNGLALFDRSLISRCNVPLAIELEGPDRRTIRRQELIP